MDLIERDGLFAVRADDVTLARTLTPTAKPASARHRCLTALLEATRNERRWLGILHAAAVAEDGRCVLLPGEGPVGGLSRTVGLVSERRTSTGRYRAPWTQDSCEKAIEHLATSSDLSRAAASRGLLGGPE